MNKKPLPWLMLISRSSLLPYFAVVHALMDVSVLATYLML